MYSITAQVRRKTKPMTRVLKKAMAIFAAVFVIMGITISQGFMLSGFLLAGLYFVYDVASRKEYEYRLEDSRLAIDVILGGRYRKKAHVIDLKDIEAVAPPGHQKVAKYKKNGGSVMLKKYDYTSYEPDVPYYTVIAMEGREKIKLLLDLDENMLLALKRAYPDRVFLT